MKRGRMWGLLFILLALLSVWAVISHSESFSFDQFKDTLYGSNAGWMIAAIAAMSGFILFEGMALLCILKVFGYRKSFGRGFLYSSADVYFSAITPSATGGQPASAYFMMQDGIPGPVVTISLVANLIMYTLALLTVGMAGFAVRPQIFFQFHLPGRILITFGYVVLCALTAAFYMLIVKPRILERICEFFLKFGKKLHLVKNEEKKREKLHAAMEEYGQCARLMTEHKAMFVKAYFLNLLQRVSQITVTLFVYMAIGGGAKMAVDIWFLQSFVAIGTYSVPIPGGMGVADYLLLDGFRAFMSGGDAVNLELISRGVSFYVCMILSAGAVLAGIILEIRRKRKNGRFGRGGQNHSGQGETRGEQRGEAL